MKILRTLLFTVLGLAAFAQVNAQKPQIGIKGGLNLSSMSIDEADDSNIMPGFQAGVYTRIPIGQGTFSIQPEALYSAKGLKTAEADFNLNYIEVPLKIAYNLAPDFNFHAGPYVGYLLNAKAKGTGQLTDISAINDAGKIDRSQFKNLDVGLIAGMGFSLNRLDLGFDYSFGFLPTADQNKDLAPVLGNAKNNVIQVHLGYRF